ncbi:serine/threonine-protein kinase [Terriglobus sp. TAA 43]|uniref:serine/threonine protein kinase n=1 Tax=Terriglobus sp. TAA 43 TaxID=278961 RepID=UPI0006482B13|nr:serine/threonine-protein kinase [Terriglobus sp. TAA 43]
MNNSAEWLLRTETIFHEIIAIDEPERSAVLEERCGDDDALLMEIRSLVVAYEAEECYQRDAAEAEQPVADEPHRIGPYAMDKLLGRGGMGAVYLAHRVDGQFQQQVAIKIIDLPLATDLFRDRFRTERQILAGLSHPYIARLLDGGVSPDGELYLAMEYIEGVSITQYCEAHALNVDQRLALFHKVCEAVQYAHQNLIVHRDLKPDNILVDADGNPHLLDFGTAKILTPLATAERDLTQAGFQTFTPRYASPEQVLGQPITIASDIYSLGVLLYVLLTGGPPYELNEFTTEEMVRVICGQEPRRPSAAGASLGKLDADVDSIVLKALRKESQERYATVDQMAADVQAYLEQRPVRARRGNRSYLAGKFVRRNKLAIGAASLLFVSVIAGAAGVAWQSRVANMQRRKAEARSEDLRQLSASLLSELDDAIKELPGSTSAQKLLVTRVLEHLDRMSADGADDQLTQLDVADGYTRIGNLQGNQYDQNIGDAVGGLASLDKAVVITEKLKTLHPNDPAVQHAYGLAEQSRGEVLFGMGRLKESVESLRHASVTFGDLALAPKATSLQMSEAATAYGGLGDVLGQTGRLSLGDSQGARDAYRASLRFQQSALQADPHSARARRSLPISMMKIGNTEFDRDPWVAKEQYQASLQAMENYPAELKKGFAYTRTYGGIARKYAAAQAETGDYAGSIKTIETYRPAMAAYVKADPTDDRALADLNAFLENEAGSYESLMNPLLNPVDANRPEHRARAIALLEQTDANYSILMKRNPHDETSKGAQADVQVRLGVLEQANGQRAQGAAKVEQGLGTLRELVQPANAPVFLLDQISTDLLRIKPLSQRDSQAEIQYALRAVALNGQKPIYRLTLAQSYRSVGDVDRAHDAARAGLSLLAPARPGEGMTRTRRLLEAELK